LGDPISKILNTEQGCGGVARVVERLLSNHEAEFKRQYKGREVGQGRKETRNSVEDVRCVCGQGAGPYTLLMGI
jgi:hypothetical protein